MALRIPDSNSEQSFNFDRLVNQILADKKMKEWKISQEQAKNLASVAAKKLGINLSGEAVSEADMQEIIREMAEIRRDGGDDPVAIARQLADKLPNV